MSAEDQEHTLHLISQLLRKPGARRTLGFLILAPIAIGSLIAVLSYNFTAVEYLRGLNYAKQNAPVVVAAIQEERDTLARHGFRFNPISFFKP